MSHMGRSSWHATGATEASTPEAPRMGDPPMPRLAVGGSLMRSRSGIAPLSDMKRGARVTPQRVVWPQG